MIALRFRSAMPDMENVPFIGTTSTGNKDGADKYLNRDSRCPHICTSHLREARGINTPGRAFIHTGKVEGMGVLVAVEDGAVERRPD